MEVADIYSIAADVDANDLAEDDLAAGSKLERHVASALKRSRCFENTRAFHSGPRSGAQACSVELVDLRAELDRADLHLLDHCIITDMDGELAGFPHIARSILESHVGIVLDADGNDGGIVRQYVEEAEWAGIGIAITIDRGDQSDRARDDGADQQLVFLPLDGNPMGIERGMAAEVFVAVACDQIEVANIAAGRQGLKPLRVQHEDHALLQLVVVMRADVKGILAASHADRMAKIGIMRSLGGRIDVVELATLPLPIGIRHLLARNHARSTVGSRRPIVRHGPRLG
uniref:3,4-dihydroxy-2-butanone-4-phosphate synthase n=1 Tax=Parastrongyloides trichosuri TaxID=131310 RepID=A0A0N4Z1I6_PARTI